MLFDNKRWKLPTPRESDVVEALKAARARLEQGWCSKGGFDDYGGVCPIIAISHSARERGMSADVREDAYAYFRMAIDGDGVADWNEAPGRTKAQVLSAADRATDMARRGAKEQA